jgi:hypothetical protein
MSLGAAILACDIGEGVGLRDRDGRSLEKPRHSARISFLAFSSHYHFGRQDRCFIHGKTRLFSVGLRQYQLFSPPALGDRGSPSAMEYRTPWEAGHSGCSLELAIACGCSTSQFSSLTNLFCTLMCPTIRSLIHLTISDSGVGFDVEATKASRGLGLISMQERLKLLNGTLVIESQLQRGTMIHASVPRSNIGPMRTVGQ